MKKIFFGVYNPSIILTYIGVFCGIAAFGAMLHYDPLTSMDYIPIVMSLLSVAGICDLFDGTIARMCKRTEVEKKFGIQLDSLADVISFVALPAVVVMFVNHFTWHSFIVACFYVFTGIMRLGWFNVTTEESSGYYTGLPVTTAALIFPLVSVLINLFGCSANRGIIFEIVCAIIGLLFIGNFKHKKTGISSAIIWLVIAIATIIALLFF